MSDENKMSWIYFAVWGILTTVHKLFFRYKFFSFFFIIVSLLWKWNNNVIKYIYVTIILCHLQIYITTKYVLIALAHNVIPNTIQRFNLLMPFAEIII